VRERLRDWLLPKPPADIRYVDEPDRRGVRIEVVIVFAITLGLSGVNSLISLVDSALRPVPLNKQHVAINVPLARNGFLDLLAQLAHVVQLAAWGALGLYLLWRAGVKFADIGLRRYAAGDSVGALGLAALIGIPGLGLYFAARALGVSLTVLPTALTDTWWRIPVLVLAAAANAWAEETLVVAYLITRLRQLGWRENWSVVAAALLRGSYHLYQGPGLAIGNVVMGLVFGRIWQRTNRLWVLITAHTLLDIASFVGYALLGSHLSILR
jgi:membrane protease YdiL (CAAX protease family)